MKKITSQSGLTLIELAIGMVVIGLLLVAYFQYDELKKRERLKNLGNYKAFTIADGLAKFRSQHGRLPCPASTDLPFDDVNFGMPVVNITGTAPDLKTDCNTEDVLAADVVAPGTCDHGYCVANGVNSSGDVRRVRIGAVPYKVLGIGLEDVIDIHGNQYKYAVVENQASESSDYTRDPDFTNHAITVRDYEFDPATYVVESGVYTGGVDQDRFTDILFFSLGKNGAGGHTKNGLVHPQACPASGVELENCNNDAIFVTDKYAFNSAASVTGDFDDSLVYDLSNWVYIWDGMPNDTKSIYTLLGGSMGVGIEQSTEKVHVLGNLRVDMLGDEAVPDPSLGRIQTEIICDQTKNDCFSPEHLGGPQEDSETLHCGDKDNYPFMRGVQLTANSDVKARQLENGTGCTPFVGTDTSNCTSDSAFHLMTGLTINARTGQITRRCASAL